MSISSYASDLSAASHHSHSCEIIQSNPSRQSGMVQPVVNEMFATVHAAGSSLLGPRPPNSRANSQRRAPQTPLLEDRHAHAFTRPMHNRHAQQMFA
eukprot:scaffold5475_cov127-Isochrysis_galbana.AAC.11